MVKEQHRFGELWLGDCLPLMADVPSESVKLIVTSPPYNLRNTTGGGIKWDGGGSSGGMYHGKNHPLQDGYAGHDDDMPHAEYVAWQRECLGEMLRMLRPDGAIFYTHKWRVQSGLHQDRADIMDGLPVRQIIIWDRGRTGINFNPGYFLPAYEVIYFLAKPDFYLTPQANRYGTLWRFPPERDNPHPAPFPVELPRRVISAALGPNADPEECVVDPFIGSGTTAVAAINHGVRYLGIEKSPDYFAMARARIAQVESQGRLL